VPSNPIKPRSNRWSLFDDDPVGPFMAEDNRAFCVDFMLAPDISNDAQATNLPIRAASRQ
jgi:hypothetical protein